MSVSTFFDYIGRNFQSLVRWWLRLAASQWEAASSPKKKTIVFQTLMFFFPGQLLVSVRIQDTSSITSFYSVLPNFQTWCLMYHAHGEKLPPRSVIAQPTKNWTILRKIHVFQPAISDKSNVAMDHPSVQTWASPADLAIESCFAAATIHHITATGTYQVGAKLNGEGNIRENPLVTIRNPGFTWKIYGQCCGLLGVFPSQA